ncbi:MAG: ABC transporter ATP-binding protein [Fimbriimonadia bacterium]|nr:ABC transporter ATP-binding protein [Fimbriimonadia bacterium]
MNNALLSVRDLRVYYEAQGRVIKAVDGVSFDLNRGETLGLVGESGCGKSTVGRALASLLQPKLGQILWEGKESHSLSRSESDALYRRRQIVFQDPYASLNPLWRVRDLVAEPLRVHRLLSGDALTQRVSELLDLVGMDERFAARYPSELSGGQRQRVAIARALSTEPDILILDEPTAALDISVRAQILNLLLELREKRGLSILLITHDFSVVQSLANRIAVMYLGKIVETAETTMLLETPRHPYTQMLIRSVLPPRPTGELPDLPAGEVPDLFDLPSGCRFRTRCPKAVEACAASEPDLNAWKEDRHSAACFRAQV